MQSAAKQASNKPIDVPELERITEALDPVVCLAALIQITGDRSLLHRYGPALEGSQHRVREAFVDFGEDERAPSPEAERAAAEVCDRLREAVKSGRPPIMTHLDRQLFHALANLVTGVE